MASPTWPVGPEPSEKKRRLSSLSPGISFSEAWDSRVHACPCAGDYPLRTVDHELATCLVLAAIAAKNVFVQTEEENTVWRGGPSQIVNLPTFAACLVMGGAFLVVGASTHWSVSLGAIICALVAGWKWLIVRCLRFEITTERLKMIEGVLNQDIDEVELYRVKDTRILRPIWLRFFGLGNVVLETSDRTHPRPVLNAIKDAAKVREELRRHVEKLRDQKRVREVDFDETSDSEFGDELG